MTVLSVFIIVMYHILKCGIRSAYLELMHATCIHKFKKSVATPRRDGNFLKNLFTLFDQSTSLDDGDFRKLHSDSSTFIVFDCWSQICMITFPKNVIYNSKNFYIRMTKNTGDSVSLPCSTCLNQHLATLMVESSQNASV